MDGSKTAGLVVVAILAVFYAVGVLVVAVIAGLAAGVRTLVRRKGRS